jgi:hypothetical protein
MFTDSLTACPTANKKSPRPYLESTRGHANDGETFDGSILHIGPTMYVIHPARVVHLAHACVASLAVPACLSELVDHRPTVDSACSLGSPAIAPMHQPSWRALVPVTPVSGSGDHRENTCWPAPRCRLVAWSLVWLGVTRCRARLIHRAELMGCTAWLPAAHSVKQ